MSAGYPRFESLESRIMLDAVAWDGDAGDMLWSSPANWSGDALPGAADDVTIDIAGDVTVAHDTGDTVIGSLASNEAIVLTGGSLSIAGQTPGSQGAFQVNNTFSIDGGALADAAIAAGDGGQGVSVTDNAGNRLSNVTLAASLSLADAADRLTLADGLTLDAATITLGADAVLDVENSMTLGGSGAVNFTGAAATPSRIVLADGVTLTTGAGVTATVSRGVIDNVEGGSATFVNAGTLRGSSVTVNTGLTNRGLLDCFFDHSVHSVNYINGAFANEPAATVRVRAYTHYSGSYEYVTLNVAGDMANAGTIELTDTHHSANTNTYVTLNVGGTLTNEASGTITIDSSLGGVGSRAINGAVDNRGVIDVNRALKLEAAGVDYVNSGAINVLGGGLSVRNFDGFTNTPAGAINATATGLEMHNFTYLDNDGDITVAGGAFNSTGFTDLNNSGVITVTGGNWKVTSYATLTTSGTIDIAGGRDLDLTGGLLTYAGGAFTSGRVFLRSGTLDLAGDLQWATGNLYFYVSTVNGPGILTNESYIGGYHITFNADVANRGTLDFHYNSAGSTNYLNGEFSNESGALTQVRAQTHYGGNSEYARLSIASGFTNAGDIVLTDSYSSANTNTYVTLDVGGVLINDDTGVIDISSTLGVGTRAINGGIDNRGVINVNRYLKLETAGVDYVNSGTINVLGGGLSVKNFGTFTNTASGVIDASATGLEMHSFTTLDNDGAITVGGGAMNTTGFTTIDNAGTVTVTGGNWNASSYADIVSSGSISLPADRYFDVSGGVVTYAGGTLTAGRLYLRTAALDLTAPLTWAGGNMYLYVSTVNGTAGLTNESYIGGYSFAFNADLTNRGTIDFHYNGAGSTNYINGAFVNEADATTRVRAYTYYSGNSEYATLNVSSGFTNAGTIELTDSYHSSNTYTYVTLNVDGVLLNDTAGVINVTSTLGGVGRRTLNAALDNRGTINVDRATKIEAAGIDHVNSGAINFAAGGTTVKNFGVFTNSGTLSFAAAGTVISSFTTFTNTDTGLLSGVGVRLTDFATLTNAGAVTIDGGAFETDAFTDMTNSGTVTVSGANWNLSSYATLTNTGTIELAADRRFSVTGGRVIHAGVAMTGGELYFSSATLEIANPWTHAAGKLYLYSSTLAGTGAVTNEAVIHAHHATIGNDLTNNGLLDFHYDRSQSVNYINGAFVNAAAGTLRVRAYTYRYYSSDYYYLVTLTVDQGFVNTGTIELTDVLSGSRATDTTVTLNVANGTLVNTGQITVTGERAGSVRHINAAIDNQGIIDIDKQTYLQKAGVDHGNSGAINVLAGGLTMANFGTLTNAATGVIDVPATPLTIKAFTTLDNAGLIDVAGGGFDLSSFTDLNNSGEIEVAGGLFKISSYTTVTNTGAVRMGTDRRLEVVGGTFIHAGTQLYAAGDMYFHTGSTLQVDTPWTMDSPHLYFYAATLNGSALVTNTGEIHSRHGTINADLTNRGLLEFFYDQSQSFNNINGEFSNAVDGTLRLRAYAYRYYSYDYHYLLTLTVDQGFVNAGRIELVDTAPGSRQVDTTVKLNVTNGTLVNTGEIHATSELSGGTRYINASVDNQGVITADRFLRLEDAGRHYTNSGTISITGGGLNIANFGTLTNTAIGVIDVSATGATLSSFTTLDNAGLIDVGGGELAVSGFETLDNSGTVEVTGGRMLLSSYTTVNNTGAVCMGEGQRLEVVGGTFIHAGTELYSAGNMYFHSSATLQVDTPWTMDSPTMYLYESTLAGSAATTNVGDFYIRRSTITADFTNAGLLDSFYAQQHAYSNINGAFANTTDGTLRVRAYGYRYYSYDYHYLSTLTIDQGFVNAGLIELTDTNSATRLTDTTVTLNVTHGVLVNTGTINALSTLSGGTRPINASIDNRGVLNVDRNVTTTLAGAIFTNTGTVNISAGRSLTQIGVTVTNCDAGTLTDGVYNIAGTWKFTGATITTNAATVVLDGAVAAIVNESNANALAGFAENTPAGSFAIRNGKLLSTPAGLANAGYVEVGDASVLTVNGDYTQIADQTHLSGGTLVATGVIDIQVGLTTGTGTLAGNVLNAGEMRPGASPGAISVTGDYTETATALLTLEIGGYVAGDEFDQLNVGGLATWAGTLALSVLEPFEPAFGDTFTLLTHTGYAGDFSLYAGLELPSFLEFVPVATTSATTFVVSVAAAGPGPTIVANPGPGYTNADMAAITLYLSEAVVGDDARDPATYSLLNFGTDRMPGGGDDTPIVVTPSYADGELAVVLTLPGVLVEGVFGLTVVSGDPGIRDLEGYALDGDANAIEGDDFVQEFIVDQTAPTVGSMVVTPTSVAVTYADAFGLQTDAVALVGTYRIIASGLDGTFGDGNEVDYTAGIASVSFDEVTGVATLEVSGALPEEAYQLTVLAAAGVADLAENLLTDAADVILSAELVGGPATVAVALQAGSDSGVSAGDGLTNVAAPTVDVTVNKPGTVSVDFDGQVVVVPVPTAGTYPVTAPAAMADGIRAIDAIFTPFVGEPVGDGIALTIDTMVPPVAGGLAFADDTGAAFDDNLTSDGDLAFSWTAPVDVNGIAGYEYQWDSSGWAGLAGESVTLPASEGPHTFDVRAIDNAGNTGPAVSIAPIVDRTAPDVTGLTMADDSGSSATDGVTADTAPTFSWDAAVDDNGVWTYQYRTDAEAWTDTVDTSVTIPLADGDHDFAVRAIDNAGNMGAEIALAVTIDSTPPGATGRWPGARTNAAADYLAITFNGPVDPATFTDADVDIVSGSGATAVSVTHLTGSTYRIGLSALLGDGTHTVTVGPDIADLAGNLMDQDGDGTGGTPADTYSFDITIDTTPPPAVSGLGYVVDGGLIFTWAAPADPSGIAGYEYRWDVEAWTPVAATIVTLPAAFGPHSFAVRAIDGAGNVSDPATVAVAIDQTAPPAPGDLTFADDTGQADDDGLTADGQLVFTWAAPVVTNGLGGYEYNLDSAGWVAVGDPTVTLTLDVGEHALEVRAIDSVGTVGEIATVDVTVDLTGPSIDTLTLVDSQGTPVDASATAEASLTLAWTASDANGVWYSQWRLDGGEWSDTGDQSVALTLGDGWHTLNVRAVDPAGNVDSVASTAVLVDTAAPGPIIGLTMTDDGGIPQPGDLINDTTPVFAWDAVPDAGGLDGYQVRIDGGPWQLVAQTTASPGVAEGVHTIEIRAVDLAGNIGPAADLAFTVDVTGPAIISHGPSGLLAEPADHVDISFDGPIDVGSFVVGTLSLLGPAGPAVAPSFTITPLGGDDYRVGFAPQRADGDYSVRISRYIYDAAGNTMAGEYEAVFSQSLANLTVEDVVATPGAPGETISVTWTTQNTGTAAIGADWTDGVYLSDDPVWDAGDHLAASVPGLTLASGESVPRMVAVTIPVDWQYRFAIVHTDDDEARGESDETDNTGIHAITATAPDLIVSDVEAPAAGDADQTIQVIWTVDNVGAGWATTAWTDRVYLSTDTTHSSDDTLLYSQSSAGVTPLASAPTGQYQRVADVRLPWNVPSGKYHLLVVADADGGLLEAVEGNNVAAHDIHVGTPDLRVLTVGAPEHATQGDAVTVSWTVKNFGAGGTGSGEWQDKVYLSADPVFGGDYFLCEATAPNLLGTGASYNQTAVVTLPASLRGAFYVLVVADGSDNVHEFGAEDNNVSYDETTLIIAEAPVPDLQPTALTTDPAGVVAGETISVTWTVANVGDVATSAGAWYDAIYLSGDATLQTGQDLPLGSFRHTGNLAQLGGQYSRTEEFVVPEGLDGTYYVIVDTDSQDAVYESGGEFNNFRSAGFDVSLQPTPDMQANSVTVDDALAGEPITVTWRVVNGGTGSLSGSWHDAIYLSTDAAYDPGVDMYLGSKAVSGVIGVDQWIPVSHDVTLPDQIDGAYHIIVVTDSVNEIIEHQAGAEDNNADGDALTITWQPPDLRVHEVTPPVGAMSGQSATIGWRVANRSEGATRTGGWGDAVYLSTDAVLDVGADTLLGAVGHSGDLLGTSDMGTVFSYYDAELLTVLPDGLSGTFYLIVSTDATDAVAEGAAENNNARSQAMTVTLTPSPDLRVTQLAAPSQAIGGTAIEVAWEVENFGPGLAAGQWTDKVYLSADTTFDSDTDELIGQFPYVGWLGTTHGFDNAYGRAETVVVPAWLSGDVYVFVVTDPDGAIYEGAAQGNNARYDAEPLTITSPYYDLAITNVSAPDGGSGQDVTVSWRVENVGNAATSRTSWPDRLYLSADTTLDAGDSLLRSMSRNGALAAGEAYTVSALVELPEFIQGEFHIIVQANDANMSEEHDAGNNAGADALTVTLTPPPDLTAALDAPDAGWAGRSVSVSWTVANDGVSPTPTFRWYDAVYLSTDEMFGGDILLGRWRHSGLLSPDESYTVSKSVSLPADAVGDFFLLLVTDASDAVGELPDGETNNVASDAIRVDLTVPADLQVAVATPAAAWSGDAITVAWTVANAGLGATPTHAWRDRAYLSADDEFDVAEDTLLGERMHSGVLAPVESYTASLTATLADGLVGEYTVFVVTDAADQVVEYDAETNNTGAAGATVYLTPPPNLQVSNVDVPSAAFVGQSISVSWTVSNAGAGAAAGGWYDAVYLSLDATFDTAADRRFGYRGRDGYLGDGETYTVTCDLSLPAGFIGSYYVFVLADSSDGVYEHGDEGDNAGYDVTRIAITLPAPSDLAVLDAQLPVDATPGDPMTVAYTIRNDSIAATVGGWTDVLYLSADDAWDLGDVRIASVVNGALGAGESRTVSRTVTTAGVVPGDYHLLVRTDAFDTVSEGAAGEANNMYASDAVTNIDVAEASIGGTVSGTLTPTDRSDLYRVVLPAGKNLWLALDGHLAGGANELYVGVERIPTRADYDYRAVTYWPDVELVVPGEQAETVYYALVYGARVGAGSDYDLSADSAEIKLQGVTPSRHGRAADTLMTLSGVGFADDTAIELVAGDGATYSPIVSEWRSVTEMRVTWPGVVVPAGLYTVRIRNAAGDTSELADAFEMVDGGRESLETNLILPGAIGYHVPTTLYLQYWNSGDVAMASPLLLFTAYQQTGSSISQRAALTLDPSICTSGWLTSLPAGTYNAVQALVGGEVPGLIQPGEGGVLPVYYQGWQLPYNFAYPPIIFSAAVAYDAPIPIDWEKFASDIYPPGIDDGVWAEMFGHLQAQIGLTWDGYHAAIRQNAARRREMRQPDVSLMELFDDEVDRAIVGGGASIIGTVRNADDPGAAVPSMTVQVQQVDGPASYTAISRDDGRFVTGFLPAGTYEVTVEGGYYLNGPMQVDLNYHEDLHGVNLDLHEGAAVTGRVIDDAAAWPLAGATVYAIGVDGVVATAVTDASGQYTLLGIPAGTYAIEARADGYAPRSLGSLVLTGGAAAGSVDFAMVGGGSITGVLTDADTTDPVADVLVTATAADGSTVSTTTDADGQYALLGLATGDWTLSVAGQAYLSPGTAARAIVAPGTDNWDVTLAAGAAIAGTVTDTDGAPIAGVSVLAILDGAAELSVGAVTDADGGYRLSPLPGGNYTVRTDSTDHVSMSIPNLAVAAGADIFGVDLVVAEGLSAAGTVTESDGTTPLSGARVVFTCSEDGHSVEALSDASGGFAVSALSAGVYVVEVVAADHAASRQMVEIVDGAAPPNLAISLQTGSSVAGTVFASDGTTSLAGVVVLLWDDATGAATATVTGPNGTYGFGGLRDGVYTVTAMHGAIGCPPQVAIVVGGSLAIDLTAAADGLAGAVTSAATQQPVGGATVRLTPTGALVNRVAPQTAQTDAAGAYALASVAPGEYLLRIEADGLARHTQYVTVSAGGVVADAALAAPAPLAGTVTASGGGAIAGATVVVRDADAAPDDPGVTVVTDGAGQFLIDTLPAGTYDVVVLADGYAHAAETVVLPAGGADAPVVLSDSGSTVTVTVVDAATGLPVAGAGVSLAAGAWDVAGGAADSAGVVTLDAVALSTYDLRVVWPGVSHVSSVTVVEAGENVIVSLSLAGTPQPAAASAAAVMVSGETPLDGWLYSEGIWDDAGFSGPMSESYLNKIEGWLREVVAPPTPRTPDAIINGQPLWMWEFQLLNGHVIEAGGEWIRDYYSYEFTLEKVNRFADMWDDMVGLEEYYDKADELKTKYLNDALWNLASAAVNIFGMRTIQVATALGWTLLGELMSFRTALTGASGTDQLIMNLENAIGLLAVNDALSALPWVAVVIEAWQAGRNAANAYYAAMYASEASGTYRGTRLFFEEDFAENDLFIYRYIRDLDRYWAYAQYEPDELVETPPYPEDEVDLGEVPDYDEPGEPGSGDPGDPGGNDGTGGGSGIGDDGSIGGGFGGLPSPPNNPVVGGSSGAVGSSDPNDKIGPAGFGEHGFVKAGDALAYTIRFENTPDAPAPAQRVEITDTLDADLDLFTFELKEIAFAHHVIHVPSGLAYYATTVDLRPDGVNVLVEIEAGVNLATGELSVVYTALDADTGLQPNDPLVGLLMPNDDTGRGEGHITYVVDSRESLATGAVVTNMARIIFDTNEPIDTNVVDNTVDGAAPTSVLDPLPATVDGNDVIVSWSGADDGGGVGLADYDVYVSVDGGAFTLWLDDTTDTSGVYTAENDQVVGFYVLAADNVGWVEAKAPVAEASVHVLGLPAVTLSGAYEDQAFTITYQMLAEATGAVLAEPEIAGLRIASIGAGTLTQAGQPVAVDTVIGPGDALLWIADAEANGLFEALTVQAWDGAAAAEGGARVQIDVAPVNDAPVLVGVTAVEIEGTVRVAAMVHDVDGDPLTYTWDFGDGTEVSGVNISQGAHAYADNQPFTITLTVADGAGGTDTLATLVDVTGVDMIPPTVAATVNDGAAQRSSIRTIAARFSEDVSVDWDDLVVHNDTTGQPVALSAGLFSGDDDVAVWDLRGLDLAEGSYTATLIAAGIADDVGHALDGDADGTGGDDYVFTFHCLYGDYDGDGEANAVDIDLLAAAVRGGNPDVGLDVTGDGLVGQPDKNRLIHDLVFVNADPAVRGTAYGDADLDGYVCDNDLSLLLANWRQADAGWRRGEFSGDGFNDDDDLSLLLANWTGGPPAAEAIGGEGEAPLAAVVVAVAGVDGATPATLVQAVDLLAVAAAESAASSSRVPSRLSDGPASDLVDRELADTSGRSVFPTPRVPQSVAWPEVDGSVDLLALLELDL